MTFAEPGEGGHEGLWNLNGHPMRQAALDFDIKLSDWLTGALVLHFDSGTGAIFPTGNSPVIPNTPGVGVDRFTLDRTHILVGDLMQFP